MDLSSLNNAMNTLINRTQTYLDNLPELNFATYEQQLDVPYVSNQYSRIVELYSNLLKLQTDIQYFISQCNKIVKLMPGNTTLEKAQINKVKTAISLVKEVAEPLDIERDRLKTVEMFYRSLFNRKDI